MIKVTKVQTQLFQNLLSVYGEAFLTRTAQEIANAAYEEWKRLGQSKLGSTRIDYVSGIQPVDVDGTVATVTLAGMLPNMIEQGAEAFDMHDTLLGPNVPLVPRGEKGKHKSKSGSVYRAIPFRHTTPTSGPVLGTPMGSPYKGHPGVTDPLKLGKKIYRAALKLKETTSEPGMGSAYGGKTSRLKAGLAPILRDTPKQVVIQGVTRTAQPHSTDIYAGMIRQRKTYEKGKGSQYTTFRIISDAVPDKWLHPGIKARNFVDEVATYVEDIGADLIENFTKGLMG